MLMTKRSHFLRSGDGDDCGDGDGWTARGASLCSFRLPLIVSLGCGALISGPARLLCCCSAGAF